MVGAASKSRGRIHLCDPDTVSLSNLTSQFLFTRNNAEKKCYKALVASSALKSKFPSINTSFYTTKYGKDHTYDIPEKILPGIDIILSGIDSVPSRHFIDNTCQTYSKPFIDAGIDQSKGHVQVVYPFLTQTYSSISDYNEGRVSLKDIRYFPTMSVHSIHFAQDLLHELFILSPSEIVSYRSDEKFLEKHLRKLETMENIFSNVVTEKPKNFADCLRWARARFEQSLNFNSMGLLHNFPHDMIDAQGG